ncbi:hypothetical protein HJC23_004449 [Cyclotella cryptica]|uniref:Protein kinase domain-containing protein n=1 Tax=Cyclotella cryptica TaxID=29204 RepID=A0ABD3QE77_9STRA|eukprot:CCRYP_006056-RA/>CCRYP_006056-RA protein AED:0.16 eAED:-0.06 QI:0/0/0/1/1/1/2/0/334
MIASILFPLVAPLKPFHTSLIDAITIPSVGIVSQSTINHVPNQWHHSNLHAKPLEMAAWSWLLTSSFEPSRQYSWTLQNGNVQFETPLTFPNIAIERDGTVKPRQGDGDDSVVSLTNPVFLGSGGSGAVFSFGIHPLTSRPLPTKTDAQPPMAIKVSWKASRTSVQNECTLLKSMELHHVPHVERCLGERDYPYEDGRVMIALQPVLVASSGITSSISDVSLDGQERAVKQVMETMIGMLYANIVTVDVQALISKETGEVLFIDFSEAMEFGFPVTAKDVAAVVGFCNEMMTLVPESLRDVAVEYLKVLLEEMDRNGMSLSKDISNVLESIWME